MSLLKIASRDREVSGTPANCRIPLAQSIKGVYRVHTVIIPNAAPALATITNPALVLKIDTTENIVLTIKGPTGIANTNNLPVRDRYYDIDNLIVDLNTNLANNPAASAVGLSVIYETHSSRLRFLKTDTSKAVEV